MRASLLFLLSSMACTPADPVHADTLAVDQAGPAQAITLNAYNMVDTPHPSVGDTHNLIATGVNSGATVYFVVSIATAGPNACPSTLPDCLSIRDPFFMLGSATADGTGKAALTIDVPASLDTGARVDFQAVSIGGGVGISNPVNTHALLLDGFHDQDGDDISDSDELFFGTDPLRADTDNDGLTDGVELLALATDPLDDDSDDDGVSDFDEVVQGTNPGEPDSDYDGCDDAIDGFPNDASPDSDGDGFGEDCDACPTDPSTHEAPCPAVELDLCATTAPALGTATGSLTCADTTPSGAIEFDVYEISANPNDCIHVFADNSAVGAADLLAYVTDASGAFYGLAPDYSQLDDEATCSTAAWDGFACPEAAVSAGVGGTFTVYVGQWGGGCLGVADYTLSIGVNGVGLPPGAATQVGDDVPADDLL